MLSMIRILFLVGGGSCVGGISRYLLQQFVQDRFPTSIPLGTLAVNIVGCFMIGIVYALANRGNILTPQMRLLLATGFCGGFTTFSSFAYENVSMVLDREFYFPTVYIVLSVLFGFGAVHAGILLTKLIFKL